MLYALVKFNDFTKIDEKGKTQSLEKKLGKYP